MDYLAIIVHSLYTFSLISSSQFAEVASESICVRANPESARCKFYCGQDAAMDISAIDGSSVQPR